MIESISVTNSCRAAWIFRGIERRRDRTAEKRREEGGARVSTHRLQRVERKKLTAGVYPTREELQREEWLSGDCDW